MNALRTTRRPSTIVTTGTRLGQRPSPSNRPTLERDAPKTYVLDTSVLLSDPRSFTRFEEHEVVVPLVVLTELEAKRNHPELGWAARQALRALEDLRTEHGTLVRPLPVNDAGGTLRVEINHQELAGLPAALRARPTTTASSPSPATWPTRAPTSPSSPRTCRCGSRRASSAWPPTSTATSWWPTPAGPGFVELDVETALIDELFERPRRRPRGRLATCPATPASRSTPARSRRSARVRADKRVHLVRTDAAVFDVRGRSAEQRVAIDLLTDPEIGIVSLGGNAGTGKSVLALAAGLEAVLEARTHKRVVVFRPLYSVGGQELGFLPGQRGREDGARGRPPSSTPSSR